MGMAKDIEGFSKEPGLRAPSKFTNDIDDFIFEETHEARADLWSKAKAGDRTAQRKLATKYNIRVLTLNKLDII